LHLVFMDHRGFAKATREVSRADFGLDAILDDVDLLRQHLGLDRVVVIGHSGQGYMALEYAKRYPQHVSHVVIIGTGPSHGASHMDLAERHWREAVCPERKARHAENLSRLQADIEAAPERRFVTFCIRMCARTWFDPHYDAAPLWEGVHVNMEMFDVVFGETFRDIDIRRGLDAFDIPVLLALGRFDYLVAPAFTWDAYRGSFKDLTVRVFDRSGHSPHQEESDLFDGEVLRWLDARQDGAGRHPSLILVAD